MKPRARTLGLLGIVVALALAACGGDDDTPAPQPTATRVSATATPADTPTPIVITVAGTPMVVTATPAPTSTPAPTAAMTRKPTGTLNVVGNLGNEQFVLRLNPPLANMLISDPLVWWDWGVDGPTNEAILEDWTFNENADGSVDWQWTIKPGIEFAKGWGEVTSTDLKFVFVEHLKEGTVNANRRGFGQWYGSDPNNLDDSDPMVLKIHQPSKFNVVEQWRVMSAEEGRTFRPFPKAYMDQVGEDGFKAAPVYAGPYEFQSQQRGYDVVFTAVQDHYRVTPGFETIHFFKVLDLATKVAMLRTGQIDVGTLPGRLAAEVEEAGVNITVSKNSVEPFIQFGGLFPDNPTTYDPNFPWTTDTPLEGSAVQVRKALNYAIDRDAILDKILFGFGETIIIAFSFLSSTAGAGGGPPEWWNNDWEPIPFDPAQARQILKDAGHEGCFEWNQWHIAGQVYGPDVGEAVAGMWEEHLGCKINRRIGEYRPGLRGMLLDQKTNGWTYLFEGGPIARPQRYACLHGGPTYQVIMHTTLQFYTDLCYISDRSLDPVEVVNIERQIGDWEYKTFSQAAVVSVHTLFGVSDKVKDGSYVPFPKKQGVGGLEFALPA